MRLSVMGWMMVGLGCVSAQAAPPADAEIERLGGLLGARPADANEDEQPTTDARPQPFAVLVEEDVQRLGPRSEESLREGLAQWSWVFSQCGLLGGDDTAPRRFGLRLTIPEDGRIQQARVQPFEERFEATARCMQNRLEKSTQRFAPATGGSTSAEVTVQLQRRED